MLATRLLPTPPFPCSERCTAVGTELFPFPFAFPFPVISLRPPISNEFCLVRQSALHVETGWVVKAALTIILQRILGGQFSLGFRLDFRERFDSFSSCAGDGVRTSQAAHIDGELVVGDRNARLF